MRHAIQHYIHTCTDDVFLKRTLAFIIEKGIFRFELSELVAIDAAFHHNASSTLPFFYKEVDMFVY